MSVVLFTAVLMVQAQNQKTLPEEKSIVNKEFDENGNLLRYDSTYVWQWNSDSTFNFSFGDKWPFGQKFPGMFEEFFNDSVFEKFGLFNDPSFQPFGNDDFFGQFGHSFPGFPFENDSVFQYHFGQPFQDDFGMKEFEELQKQLQEKFNQHNLMVPEFKSPEQEEEWEKLMQKQQKEKEELMKKWENSQSKKTY
ncbi:MAG: hypothetical protein EP310_04820 [Bacteroidetes bacterium]|nr:MAG: hypothetical protein EP310_04820 [Bacteroidota bacterium]